MTGRHTVIIQIHFQLDAASYDDAADEVKAYIREVLSEDLAKDESVWTVNPDGTIAKVDLEDF